MHKEKLIIGIVKIQQNSSSKAFFNLKNRIDLV